MALGDEDNAKKDFVAGNWLLGTASSTTESVEPADLSQLQQEAGLSQMVEFMQTRNAHKRKMDE